MLRWYSAFHKWFSHEDCEKIIKLGMRFKPHEGTIIENTHKNNKATVNKAVRVSTIRWLPQNVPECFGIYQEIDRLFKEANSESFGFDLSHVHGVQFTEYDSKNNGGYDWHKDLVWLETNTKFQRKLSLVVNLTKKPDFEGGRLEFLTEGQKLDIPEKFADRGTVIVFPSFLTHRVPRVTKGVRHSLVSWCCGPHFR